MNINAVVCLTQDLHAEYHPRMTKDLLARLFRAFSRKMRRAIVGEKSTWAIALAAAAVFVAQGWSHGWMGLTWDALLSLVFGFSLLCMLSAWSATRTVIKEVEAELREPRTNR